MAEERELWERQPWESYTAFEAFQLWLTQAKRPRSLDRAYRANTGRTLRSSGKLLRASHTWRHWFQARDEDNQPIPGAVPWQGRLRCSARRQGRFAFLGEWCSPLLGP